MENKIRVSASVLVLLLAAPAPAAAANKRICVEVKLHEAEGAPAEKKPAEERLSGEKPAPGEQTPEAQAGAGDLFVHRMDRVNQLIDRARTKKVAREDYLPLGQGPVTFLKRLFEHFVTHEKGYEAVGEGCQETITVELYPLARGWTVFARYSGNGREERVDQLLPREISQFAERAVTALLYDLPISRTIQRDTVLEADSMKSVQRIRGSNHFLLSLGTQVRGGAFSTAVTSPQPQVEEKIRVFSPMLIGVGYKGRFENWGLEALAQLGIGTSRIAARSNPDGGHIDFGGNTALSLHFLHYLQPRGVHSFYLGAGTSFELLWFSVIRPAGERYGDDRSTLFGGGLDVDVLCGWEFMRATSVQFYLQAELNLPAYVIEVENDHGRIHSWFPSLAVKLGVSF